MSVKAIGITLKHNVVKIIWYMSIFNLINASTFILLPGSKDKMHNISNSTTLVSTICQDLLLGTLQILSIIPKTHL